MYNTRSLSTLRAFILPRSRPPQGQVQVRKHFPPCSQRKPKRETKAEVRQSPAFSVARYTAAQVTRRSCKLRRRQLALCHGTAWPLRRAHAGSKKITEMGGLKKKKNLQLCLQHAGSLHVPFSSSLPHKQKSNSLIKRKGAKGLHKQGTSSN